ncbi:anti-adapter protein IraP [Enterobacteriaceae bacterium H20N1]|uniref:Anti-adapter protein IraP n=1 Tax=Dryocola boscaweniae TaxID=2925397 RepID=A0A9X2W9Z9_9ENTR|nr:anti-adapter protein IraP [Dryocola boscaweniae]MCT4703659.1 anti-adapter protein IraP [Dryocola boscaweniae]MCT4720827.1 anti-adapter protein IraP [Dryocola boscaweniae]
MKNIIISMIAKISKMDAEAKLLTAQVEAQSLLLSAMLLAVGKEGGLEQIVESVKKAINTALEASDNLLKSDTELLLTQFNELLSLTQLLAKADTEIDVKALRELPSAPDSQ